jgi:ATP-dependent exoDNAse (exonuclease V) beta subunit
VIRDEGLLLIDYKTHRVDASEIPTLVERYTPQLRLYSDGLRWLWPGKPIEAVLVFTVHRNGVAAKV